MAQIKLYGRDGKRYSLDFKRNFQLEEILHYCAKKIKLIVWEGKFPWIKRTVFGNYKVLFSSGWKKFNVPVAGGTTIGKKAICIHKNLPKKEKFAIAFHELGHRIKNHPALKNMDVVKYDKQNLNYELEATDYAIALIKKNEEYLKKFIVPDKVIARLVQRRKISVAENI